MELRIEKGSFLKDLQKEFNLVYPYLKIEFFRISIQMDDEKKPRNEKPNLVPVNISERFSKTATINMEGKTTALQLENQFVEKIGLYIKLFRKSGSLWIETTLTENWSLEKQNEEGAFMSAPVPHKNSFDIESGDEWMDKE